MTFRFAVPALVVGWVAGHYTVACPIGGNVLLVVSGQWPAIRRPHTDATSAS